MVVPYWELRWSDGSAFHEGGGGLGYIDGVVSRRRRAKEQPRSLRPIAHHQRGGVIRPYCICAPVTTLARLPQSHERSLQQTKVQKVQKEKTRIKRQDDGREGGVKKTWPKVIILLITAGLTELALCKLCSFLVF